MINNLKSTLSHTLLNLPGWHTRRKLVVIESDDWGSIRMPSKEVYEKMLKLGIPVDRCPYNRFDSLASEQDLEALFDVIRKFKDKYDNHPVITANTVVANPNFDLIRQSDFEEYFYEPFTETLKKYPAHQNSFKLWKQGISEHIFKPQFHGREHVNIAFWLRELKSGNKEYKLAFENSFWGLGPIILGKVGHNIQASFDATNTLEIEKQKGIISDGLRLFEDIFGYKSNSFIANNFIWSPELNQTLYNSGVRTLQGMKYQLLPKLDSKKRKKIYNYTGKKNEHYQTYLLRNCVFEPSQSPESDIVGKCLRDIEIAFVWRKPAIITSHRLNFIGFIDENNRKENLGLFNNLLKKIIQKWPDVEFMSSDELAIVIDKSRSIFNAPATGMLT